MLSILIPIHNQDARKLVRELLTQCRDAEIEFEIRCYDDASESVYLNKNRELLDISTVIYTEMPESLGRSRIRNILSRHATQQYLLFLDADATIADSNFINRYINAVREESLVCGGLSYQRNQPNLKRFYLHWLYGKEREQRSATHRRVKPWHFFQAANYLIPKEIAVRFPFEEGMLQYGHEETLFAMELQKQAVPIIHIDNPIEQLELQTAVAFLERHRKAIESMVQLYRRGIMIDNRVMEGFQLIHSFKMNKVALMAYRKTYPMMRKQLLSDNPNLNIFDLYRLGYFLELEQRD